LIILEIYLALGSSLSEKYGSERVKHVCFELLDYHKNTIQEVV